jgi:dTDP-L-rhamnose 4-epimerase
LESRDFVYIDDVVLSIYKCLLSDNSSRVILNIGSGQQNSVLGVANLLKKYFSSKSSIKITGSFREGDIRHNYADISKAREVIEYEPNCFFEQGLKKFVNWVYGQDSVSVKDNYNKSLREMAEKLVTRVIGYHEY